jgi:predicted DCC family thiol-disulfide oxidoreductase YuxK
MPEQHEFTESGMVSDQRRPVLFFDGGCPLCRREIAHYRRLDRDSRVEWVDVNDQEARLTAFGIDPARAMARIHAVTRDGRVVSGVRAFVVVWRELPYYRGLALLERWPRLLRFLDRVYDRFAVWRLRRRCADGVCGQA